MSQNDLVDKLKNVSEKDRQQIRQAQEMLGPDPSTMGFIKNLFWGRFREELVFPFPAEELDDRARCNELLDTLNTYLRNEHPAIEIDQDQHIPDWVIMRLFKMGIMGMIIPQKYGGGGFSVTSYNRVLERIGQTCGSTAVMVSAHQSIGCGAINLFGTSEQKSHWLPRMAEGMLSAFCLSEPNVGCDAGGQETYCVMSDCGNYYIINGEKKWATSGALSGMFTVMCKHDLADPDTGKSRSKVTALICTPDMDGIDIFSRNRAKCGIRGTWQARVRFTNVRVPKENLLHEEGRGLHVALTCLNWGRCTLSAGMVGAGRTAYLQALKWAETRHQFNRPIGEFELVREKLATMASYCYAMDSMLYMTTGIVDRNDEDIMLETAICKVFCSEMGYRCTNTAMQVMGGEGYMTENELERLWRDSRINTIVEGANEVMHAFVFAYGSKQLGEHMLAIRAKPWKKPGSALKLAAQLFLGVRPAAPRISSLDESLREHANTLAAMTREFSHQVKRMFKIHEESLITNQMIQYRLSAICIWIHAMTCSLSRFNQSLVNGLDGHELERDRDIVNHICNLAQHGIREAIRQLDNNTDDTMRIAADAAWSLRDSLPHSDYSIPEKTPDQSAQGRGRVPDQTHIQQFGSGSLSKDTWDSTEPRNIETKAEREKDLA